ncbi:uncharacterized protein LOC118644958 [Monomorium pharaonis]|uniref:uncharacterized protein LOC118644958 n=1 Tax=Monomorium pharaonis TaxID=307658 RepID=UPI0017463720|nr:uncharacterized protein LOC118644958 [Monomorium pharaonis]
MAVRLSRSYRTVAVAAGAVLACVPPWDLVARARADAYWALMAARLREGREVTARAVGEAKGAARREMMARWKRRLLAGDLRYGRKTVGAVGPLLDQWVDVARERVTFHVAQVVSEHGCFGDYLCRIGREGGTGCHQCGDAADSAQHALSACPAHDGVRRAMVEAIRPSDLSLGAVARAATASRENWRAFASFCSVIMERRKADERGQEGGE